MTKQWLEARRSYLEKIKSQIRIMSGGDDPAIEAYALENKNLYKRVWEVSDREEFFNRISESQVVLAGDFHSSPSVKRFYLKLLKDLVKKTDRPIVFGLECFLKSDQENLDLWLRGSLSDAFFLERVSWEETWGFSWEGYKKLILGLHELGIKLVCINENLKDLYKRDDLIADNIFSTLNEEGEESFFFCLIGQHHLNPTALKASLRKMNSNLDPLCLHLDPEELYFDLGEVGLLDKVEVLAYEDHFAFFSSPPWVHWQSHVLFLDEYLEEEDDEHGYDSEVNRSRDYDLVVYDYMKLMCHDLKIDVKTVKRVEVATIDEYQIKGQIDDSVYTKLQPFLDSETSFYWPEQYEAIMVVSSLNHAASVAGRAIHAQLMNLSALPWGDPASYKVWVWLEAIGYFMSKLINPKRTPLFTHNISAFLNARLGEASAQRIMSVLVKERVKGQSLAQEDLRSMSWNEVIYASRLKGSLVGDRLFELYSRGELESETLKNYMSLSVLDPRYFDPFYDFVCGNIDVEDEGE